MIITPVLVTRGLLFDRGFTSRKNTIIHCFHGSYSSRGFTFLDTRSPLRTIPVKGLVRPAAQRGLGPLNGTPTSILWNGDDDRRETSPYQTSSCSALAGTKEQGEAPSGARVAQAHSDAGRFPKRVLGRKSQSRAHYGQLPRPHKCGRPTVR